MKYKDISEKPDFTEKKVNVLYVQEVVTHFIL